MNLSVKQKTLISIFSVLAAFAVGIISTALLVSFWTSLTLWICAVVIVFALAELWPLSTRGLTSNPAPANSFGEAMQRFSAIKAHREAEIHPNCEAYVLHHGERVGKAYLLVHGISNCPFSMVDFAPRLHALGHNVLVARMPENGHQDNSTNALKNITAQSLAGFSDECVDIAAGLANRVTVVGISAGGVIAGWMGQNRCEIDRAVLIAPAYGLSSFGSGLNHSLMRLMLFLPNFSVWKDPIKRSHATSREHSYKRQSTRGMGHVMKLGLVTLKQAKSKRPSAASITLITNAGDKAVDTAMSRGIAGAWERKGAAITKFEFPQHYQLPHELIDPTEEGARPEITYPKIIELAEQEPTSSANNTGSINDAVSDNSSLSTALTDKLQLGTGKFEPIEVSKPKFNLADSKLVAPKIIDIRPLEERKD